jgi:hypothetical protein
MPPAATERISGHTTKNIYLCFADLLWAHTGATILSPNYCFLSIHQTETRSRGVDFDADAYAIYKKKRWSLPSTAPIFATLKIAAKAAAKPLLRGCP